jgi:CubicO group peptidase (beta-lactamase class C family)
MTCAWSARLTVAMALAVGACSSTGHVGLQGDPIPRPPFADSVEQLVPRLLRANQVPGVAVALVENGTLAWTQGFGYDDREAQTPMTGQTVFQVASISKSITAWGVMALVEQGKLALDTSVEHYLTRWHLPTVDSGVYRDEVTVRRLLSHTAGLSLHGYPGFDPDSGPLPTLEASLSGETNGAGDVHVAFRPGTRWEYSGGGYTLLQLLVEERSGLSFIAYMQQAVLEPLGMRNSSFGWPPALEARTAAAYDAGGRRIPNYRFTALAAAGLYTTAEDLGRYVAAGLQGPHGEAPGRGVLRPETIEQMDAPAPHSESGGGAYGFGRQLDSLVDGTRVVMHGGSNRGWKALWVAIPARRAGLIVLTNSDRGPSVYGPVLCAWYRGVAKSHPRNGC